MKVNLYDFDNTIYKGDSSTDFFFYSLMYYPKIALVIPKIILAFFKYQLKIVNKTEMKEVIFSYLKYIPNVDKLVLKFWDTHNSYIKDFYKNKKHDKDIIISASPEFLLKPICDELKVLDLIGSKVNKKSGKFTGLNCHGEEKVRRLNKKYQSVSVTNAYSDSLSDLPMLRLAKHAYKVKNDKITQINV